MFGRSAACGTASFPSREAEQQDKSIIDLNITYKNSLIDISTIAFLFQLMNKLKREENRRDKRTVK